MSASFLASPSAKSLVCMALLCFTPGIAQGLYRTAKVLAGQARAGSFPADKEHGGPPVYQRMRRVHANIVENLPPYATLVLTAAVAGRLDITDPLAMPFLYARLAQSGIHTLSTSDAAITVRAVFYFTQVAIMVRIGTQLLGVA